MSVLPNQTNISPGTFFFWTVDASTITAKSFVSDRVLTDTLSTGSITTGAVSTTGSISVNGSVSITSNLTAGGDITALNVTATDTLNSYFINTQYITSYNGANIHNLLLADQIQGSNLVQFPRAILSSICTTSITLDGNTLDTAGSGIGASLLLNGYPVATTSTLASSILTWSYYPALSNVDMSGKSLIGAANIQATTGSFYDVTAVNQVVTSNIFATGLFLSSISSQITNANLIRAGEVSTLVLKANTAQIRNTLTAQQLDVTTLNATNITTATLVTTSGGSVTADNGNFGNLNVTNSANFSGSRPNFTTGINTSGANNFNNQSIDNAPNINTQGNQSMTIASANGMDLTAPTRIQLLVDGGNDIGSFKPINLIAGNGNRGQVNITGNPGYPVPGTPQTFGEVNIVANGGGTLTTYATGGSLNLTANTGSSPILGTVSFSAIKINAAGITSYAGFASPIIAVPGYNLIQGSLGIELIAGSIPGLPSVPGTIYLYGATGVAQTTGGVRCQNGLGIDFIVPYPQGFITPPYDLIISGNPAGQKVTLSNVRTLQSDGGTASGFTSMTTSNFQASNIIMFGDGANNGTILGLSGLEKLLNFGLVSSSSGTFGLGLFGVVSTPLVLAANMIAPNTTIQSLNNVSTINGFTIAQLVSSVGPPLVFPSTVSTFNQLFTSSIAFNGATGTTADIQAFTGVSTINGFTIAQLISTTSPVVFPSTVSTFNQLFTNQLTTSSINSLTTLNLVSPGGIFLNGAQPLSTQGSTFGTLFASSFQANAISTGLLTVSTINGFNIGQLVNQPLVSTFCNIFVSDATLLNITNITLTTSSINGFNVNQFLSTPGQSNQVSTFNTLTASSFQANTISAGLLTVSTINGLNISQLVNPALSTVSTFAQLFTSSLVASNIQTSNLLASNVQAPLISSIQVNTQNVVGVSTINGFTISQFVSSVSPQPPIPSTVNQFFTSSLAANVITNYQNQGVDILAPGYINIHAGTGVNIIGDQCNVTVTSANIIENALANYTNNTSANYTVTVGCNISMNSSNTLSIYNTNSAPPVNPNDLHIIGQGTTTLAGQAVTNITAVGALNLAGSPVNINGSPYLSNVFIQLFAYQLSNNPTVGSGALGILASSEIDLAAPVIQIQAAQDILLYSSNSYTQASNVRIIGSNQILLQSRSTICTGDIRASTFNGLPLPSGGSGNVSTFTTVFTRNLSNNAAIQNDLFIDATNAIHIGDSQDTSISLGSVLQVDGNMSLFYTSYTTIDSGSNAYIRGQTNLSLQSLSSINIGAPVLVVAAPTTLSGSLNMSNNNINNAGIITSSNIFAGTAAIGTPTYFGNNFAYFGHNTLPSSGSEYALLQEFNGTTFLNCSSGRLLRFRQNNVDIFTADSGGIYMNANLNMCNNNINNLYQLNFSNGANIDAAYGDQLNFNASNSYFLGNLRFYGSNRTLDIADNQIYACRYIYGASSGFLNINAVYGMTIENNQGANILLNSNGSIGITASNISVSGSVNANCNAISNVGTFSRYLISTELPQPVIQYAYVSTTGALTGTITVTLPQRYTSVNSYIPFAVVQNDATTTFYVSTITRATFEIGWSGYTGFGDIIFSWNCLGN